MFLEVLLLCLEAHTQEYVTESSLWLYYKLRNTTDVTLYFESDFHTCTIGGKEGDTSYTPSKDFEKFGHKNAIKHENRRLPSIFSQSQAPPSTEIENNSIASMVTVYNEGSQHLWLGRVSGITFGSFNARNLCWYF